MTLGCSKNGAVPDLVDLFTPRTEEGYEIDLSGKTHFRNYTHVTHKFRENLEIFFIILFSAVQ